MGFRLRAVPSSFVLFVDGFITLILAVLIWRTWELHVAWVLGTLLGISMLFSGVAHLTIFMAALRLARKKVQPSQSWPLDSGMPVYAAFPSRIQAAGGKPKSASEV